MGQEQGKDLSLSVETLSPDQTIRYISVYS